MLRKIFNEPQRKEQGRLQEIMALADELAMRYAKTRGAGEQAFRTQRMIAWTKSLASTLDELEQSVYCAERYAANVKHGYVEQMDPDEEADYRRHLYFYKNGFIRVFSVLDKLGSFMNDRFELHTERMKERYSYFTVLRRMRESRQHPELLHRLNDAKSKYRESLQDLRLMRNHEVHAMNTELLDEDGRIRLHPHDRKEQIEDLSDNNATLRGGLNMVMESMYEVFRYCKKQ